jgi:SAM-dependent methyltransferase
MLVDVVHHAHDPMRLLTEVCRVTRHAVVIKDHNRNGVFADSTLRLMDWVGNARHGVDLPYNYWTSKQWFQAFRALGLVPEVYETALGIYPGPLNLVFGRSLHFVARLGIVDGPPARPPAAGLKSRPPTGFHEGKSG